MALLLSLFLSAILIVGVLPSSRARKKADNPPLTEAEVSEKNPGILTLSDAEGGSQSGANEEIDALYREGESYIARFLGEGWDTLEFRDFFDTGLEFLRNGVQETLSFFALMLGAGVLFTLLSLFFEGASGEGALLGGGVSHTVEAVLLLSVVTALLPHIRAAIDTVRSVSDFCEGILPVFVSINVLSGMQEGATFTASSFGIVLALVEEGMEKIALPALALLLACSLIPAAQGEILSLGERLYKFYLSLLTLLSVIISTAFALQNTITLGVDRATLRALRYGVGSMIPIVGQTVAGTLSALSGGVLYVKSTLGVGALVAIFSLALPPLVRLLLCRLALSLPSMLVGAMGEGADPTYGRLYRTVRRIVDTATALVALSVALFLFVIILFMKSTVSLV